MDDPEIDKSVHGYDGPINISTGTHVPKSPQEDFLAATESVGMKTFPDLGDFKSCGGFAVSTLLLRIVSPIILTASSDGRATLDRTASVRILRTDTYTTKIYPTSTYSSRVKWYACYLMTTRKPWALNTSRRPLFSPRLH